MSTARLAVRAITFDFGNTLVRVDQPGLRAVVQVTADRIAEHGLIVDRDAFVSAWAEERDRQFREDVPELREADIYVRAFRVLARLRGMALPPQGGRWDDAEAATWATQAEVDVLAEAYGGSFVDRMTPFPDASATIERLAARGIVLGILSNWPLGLTIDRFAEAQGWTPYLRAIVVSQRVGTIKPHPSIFRAAEAALGLGQADAPAILHVGDDWAADVVGASRAGWRTAYLRDRQRDTPLPTSERGSSGEGAEGPTPDVEIDELAELDALADLAPAAAT